MSHFGHFSKVPSEVKIRYHGKTSFGFLPIIFLRFPIYISMSGNQGGTKTPWKFFRVDP